MARGSRPRDEKRKGSRKATRVHVNVFVLTAGAFWIVKVEHPVEGAIKVRVIGKDEAMLVADWAAQILSVDYSVSIRPQSKLGRWQDEKTVTRRDDPRRSPG